MFHAFAQERQDSHRSQGGLGLGLAIVQNLVAAHDGSVTLESEGRGRGTVCRIRLPLSSTAVQASASIGEDRAELPRERDANVPIVDDNVDAGEILAESLRALRQCAQIRLVALTGYGLESDRRRTREAGFDEHFVKPVDIDTLDLALRSLGPQRT